MTKPYEDQLRAIREMLDNSSAEVVREGYDLLFRLWLENLDTSDFQQDLLSIAVVDTNIVIEFEHRINDLVIKEGITDAFLRLRLKKLATEVERLKEEPASRTKKIFISYSHKDEKYKDELVKMLVPLQDQGILEIWQDREIVAGDEWFRDIRDAMNTCDLALILISGDSLASRFIRDEELSKLLQRRKKGGLRVVPIIIRSCKWQSVPVLGDLQALPKDGKPVASFGGAVKRDRVWTDIATSIENLCKT